MVIRPTTLRYANDFVKQYHRHSIPTTGGKFAIKVIDAEQSGGVLHGVAICGRPVARNLDDGITLEVYRVCTDGTKNACSMLYGACQRIARNMGYRKIITYTLQSESGASVKSANFVFAGEAGGTEWNGKRKRDYYVSPPEKKNRWEMDLGGKTHDKRRNT